MVKLYLSMGNKDWRGEKNKRGNKNISEKLVWLLVMAFCFGLEGKGLLFGVELLLLGRAWALHLAAA